MFLFGGFNAVYYADSSSSMSEGDGNKTRSRVGPRHPTMSLKAGSKRATLRSRSGCERKQSYTNGPENPPNA